MIVDSAVELKSLQAKALAKDVQKEQLKQMKASELHRLETVGAAAKLQGRVSRKESLKEEIILTMGTLTGELDF